MHGARPLGRIEVMDALQRLRRAMKMTQTDMGYALGHHQTAISQAEGMGRCSPELALKVLDRWSREMAANGITLEDLITKPSAAAMCDLGGNG